MYHIGFVIEQALGHVTHTKNLQANVPADPDVSAQWALPKWKRDGLIGKIPILKSNWTIQASLQARRAIGAIQRQTPLDALFFHTQVTATLAQNWVRRIPSVVSLDATPLQYDRLGEFYNHDSGPGWLEQKKWQLNVDCFRAARHLVTWSEWAKEGLVAEYQVPPEKVTVIPPGVTVREWQRPAPRQRHDGPVKILFVGGNLARKGGLVLLDAFRTLRDEHDVELHLVTRDPLDPEPGLFVYNDMQANSDPLKQLYFDADLFALPSFGDCLPMVLSEAGAAGLPSVATDVAAMPEVVRDGESGFIVPPGDAGALAEALRRLVIDHELRLRMGRQARELVSHRFDAETNAFRLLDLLKQIAEEAKKKGKVPV